MGPKREKPDQMVKFAINNLGKTCKTDENNHLVINNDKRGYLYKKQKGQINDPLKQQVNQQ